ncbi:type II toxin-antitoxin system VapC family toxin [Jiangella anatolica]|uniref:Ribonuclease VapC n=1 Tax=Jiangella anatolica TaxID=2670374 RepID=A0A2W2C5F6_9ACTN|nr:type II toxin-antitoxin system VapC family toxin [Jiangella anatolica]PZF80956.1 VapC toxin family PIN domain ribonuclease [Jiangella anatolica]
MTIVVDAGLVVSALVDSGPEGTWAEDLLTDRPLAAPHLMPVEAASILRRAALAGAISDDTASMAYTDLQALRVELFPLAPFAGRIWDLRGNVTSYDAWYVALAEHLDCPLATLDTKLAAAPGPRCSFTTPGASAQPSGG